MTRLERKQAELERMLERRADAMRRGDIYWLSSNQTKIEELSHEIQELKKYAPMTLKALIEDRPEEFKNRFYKGMLRISLLADAVNEACEIMRDMFKKELNIDDFSLRKEVDEMRKLSQRIASFAIIPNNNILEDCIVDNEKFVDMCIKHADAHLKRKLKI